MKSKLEGTVHYLQFVECTLDAAKENEETQDRPPNQQESVFRPTYILELNTTLQR